MENKIINQFLRILMLLPSLIVTIMIVLMCVMGPLTVFIFILYYWLTISATIAFIILLIISMIKRKNGWWKVIFYWGLFNILFLFVFFAFIRPQQTITAEKMAKHYEKNKTGIEELCDYFVNAIDDSCYVDLMFNKRHEISKLVVRPVGEEDYITWNHNSDVNSLLLLVGLNDDEVDNIQKKLKNVGCIGICYSDKYDKIDLSWKYSGPDRFYYELLNRPMTDEEKERALTCGECGIPYNDHIVFHKFVGTPWGYIDFSSEQRDKYLEKHQPW